ncbi:MAG: EFR1 family ferrodoxin [Firmicutes bacterium]|nr:EFR1 family ferrodoxin [Bacillota bacterium]
MSSIWTLYFSPTGSTKTIIDTIGGVVSGMLETEEPIVVDFTQPHMREKKLTFAEEDIVFVGVPTYAGRVPNKIMPFIAENLAGNGAYAVPVVTYGNRSFDDSLAELADLLEGNGFRLLGGGAFPCQHAFAENLATGRPDMMDVLQALQLGEAVANHLASGTVLKAEAFPGNHPAGPYYVPKGTDGQPAKFLKAKPVTDQEKCTQCGICAKACPMGSIDPAEKFEATGICIKCQACIKKCPVDAKHFDDEAFLSHRQMLMDNFGTIRKEVTLVI